MSIAARIGAALVALLAVAAAVFYVRELRAELAESALQLAGANRGIVDRDDTIKRLQDDAAEKARQQKQLDSTRAAIASQLETVLTENRRLKDENAEIRAWADTPLPFDIARLHNTPAQTGADDYAAAVSDRAALHAPGDGPAH
ncbi:LysB family phage lysis regulatory protein [Paraburkholderia silvatlantica]|uniref:LysB family phage lysis regulatory protein n=1 Tax=Paraburkholderia silvatlantica TaxID=321895 RepID=A0A2V4UBN8_9BURK|nr:Rz-like lysis system protein LysB [Paraburkholderia silvatlantica]PYE27973.1 LysB family phage lysis regulatory protein [Paraburkholderia silvatlantica]